MNKKTGGPAFPHVADVIQMNGNMATVKNYTQGGMTLRDYFAAKAMAALYASRYEYEFTGAPRTPEFCKLMDELAVDAYQMADAMLKAREQ